ncbi:unnamed protein product [Moneuplotes crassus]|uniref:Uncharacterized protein n=1 Tax=Euplotes crassus TaxID=5936 RepID=A0AAD1Y670_EUPCR|nr:unnamed protein product [Moneuplotes crassus]
MPNISEINNSSPDREREGEVLPSSDVSQIAKFVPNNDEEAPFNLGNNIENYFYYTEEDKWEDDSAWDHSLSQKFKNLMDHHNISEDFIINNIKFEDIFDHDRVIEGYLKIDLYGLKIVPKDFLIDKNTKETNFIQCEEDSFLEYVLNMKNNISEEKMEVMKLEYYHVPYTLTSQLVCQRIANKKSEVITIEITTKDFRTLNIVIKDMPTGIKLFENLKKLCFSSTLKDYSYCIINAIQLNMSKQEPVPISASHDEWSDKSEVNKPIPQNGWKVYDFKKEFKRQGVNEIKVLFGSLKCWGNKDSFSTTYPERVFVPLSLRQNKRIIVVGVSSLSIEMSKI